MTEWKIVAKFKVITDKRNPYGKFIVKIYKKKNGKYSGFTDLQALDTVGDFYGGVGRGNTIEEALESTIKCFFENLEWKEEWKKEDFEFSDPYDF